MLHDRAGLSCDMQYHNDESGKDKNLSALDGR